jgi:hypothetical protein
MLATECVVNGHFKQVPLGENLAIATTIKLMLMNVRLAYRPYDGVRVSETLAKAINQF